MKKLLSFLSLIFVLILSVSCGGENGGSEATNYPEGAIILTKDNFDQYFTVKVTSDLSVDYIVENGDYDNSVKQTKAVAYVAFIPKEGYSDIAAEVKYVVNSAVSIGYSSDRYMSLAIGEKSLRLGKGITNTQYKATFTTNLDYKITPNSNSITLNSVTGYIMPAKDIYELNEYEAARVEQTADGSSAVLQELAERVDAYENSIPSFESYKINSNSYYTFKSLYGAGRNKTNEANLKYSSLTVDVENKAYKDSVYIYYLNNDAVWQQIKNSAGLIEEKINPNKDPESFMSELAPSFANLFDLSAIYIKSGEDYYGYTTLMNMQNSVIKEKFRSSLENYGITSGWDKFVVTYSYYFVDGGFDFTAKVHNVNNLSPVEYVDNTVSYGFEISDINASSIEVYTPENSHFALEDNLDDALKYRTGLETVTPQSTEISFSLYQDEAENPTSLQENYLPILITESGLYEFYMNGRKLDIFSAETRLECGYYYEAGLYYYRHSFVPYGKTDAKIDVVVTVLNDYADMQNPIEISGQSFDIYLESEKDKQAFAFIPQKSGMYEFEGLNSAVRILLYDPSDLEDYISACHQPNPSLYLEEGKRYILAVYASSLTQFPHEETLSASYLGLQMAEPPRISEEWTEVFFGNGMFYCYFDVETQGYYTLEIDRISGADTEYGIFFTPDGSGSDVDIKEIVLPDGRDAYYLTPGRYYYGISAMSNAYYKARIRYTLEVASVITEQSVQLSFDEYTELSAYLPTIGSSATFYLDIPEVANLLWPSDHFVYLYREDGSQVRYSRNSVKDVFHGKTNCYQWLNLAPGKYSIILINNNYGGDPKTTTEHLRLQKVTESELQYFYMLSHPELSKNDISVRNDYSAYLGYRFAVLDIAGEEHTAGKWSENIGGYEFRYADSNRITVYVYESKSFISLEEFYLSFASSEAQELADILSHFYEKHKESYPELYSEQQ